MMFVHARQFQAQDKNIWLPVHFARPSGASQLSQEVLLLCGEQYEMGF